MEKIKKIPQYVVVVLVPVVLVLAAVRFMLTPVYFNVEYRLPYFPEDRFGFSLEDRLYWANLSVEYLVEPLGDRFLTELRFPQGEKAAGSCDDFAPPRDCTYFYNDRELRHMFDVEGVVDGAMWVLSVAVVLVVGLGYWARKSDRWAEFLLSLSRGGWLTVGLIVAILVYLVLNFDSLFVTFHRIFFEGDTWLFLYSDSLIRLFPEVFWRDSFIWIGAISLGAGAALGYFLGFKRKG